jgi:hypothetical protein
MSSAALRKASWGATWNVANDALGVVDHVAQRHGERRLVALQHVPERVADEQRVDARRLEHGGEARVVAREHRDPAAFLRHLLQRRKRDPHKIRSLPSAAFQLPMLKNSRGPRIAITRRNNKSKSPG